MDDVRFSLGRGLVYPRRAGVELAPTGVGMRGARDAWSLRGLGSLTDSIEAGATRIWAYTLQYAPLPGQIDDARDACLVLKRAEEQCVRTANAFVARHNSGRMTAQEYAEYDGMRHALHDAQVGYHNQLRQVCYRTLGRAGGDQIMARVPWPGWLPPLTQQTGTVSRVTLSGLGIVFDSTAAIIIGIILGTAGLLAWGAYFGIAASDALVVQAQASALEQALEMRERLYNDCIQRGGTSAQCSQTSIAMTADAIAGLADIMAAYQRRKRMRMLKFIGIAAGGSALAVAVVAVVLKIRRRRRA